MRIALLTRRAAPARGGIESYLRQVSVGLAAAGHQVQVLALSIADVPFAVRDDTTVPPPAFEPFVDAGVEVVPFRLSRESRTRLRWSDLQTLPLLGRFGYGRARLILGRQYAGLAGADLARQVPRCDVIHVWSEGLLAWAALGAGQKLGVPVAITPFVHAGKWGDDPASAAAYRRADAVIGLLQEDCRVLQDLGVSPSKLRECSVCASPAVGDGAAWRQTNGVRGPLVAFLGVRRHYKGIDVLRRAAALLAQDIDLTVVFAGPGDPVADVPGVRIIDAGTVSDTERAAVLNAADVMCLPSEQEILPVSILEAWSAKTPVITSDIPTLAELVGRSGGGLAVPRDPQSVADAIRRVIAGEGAAMGERGHAYWLETATTQAVVETHLSLYADLIDRRAPDA